MTTLGSDALERLREERRQIDELLAAWTRHRRDGDQPPAEAARLATLIFTLLRVHAALEEEGLHQALRARHGALPALDRVAQRCDAVLRAVERAEAAPMKQPDLERGMSTIAELARAWFDSAEADLYSLANDTLPDLVALDRQLAARQEAMLSAGRAR